LLADGRVVLNAADEQEMCQLPRVGPAKAKKIIALREKLGRFRSPRDLLRVKGIGAKTLQQMMPKLVLDDPEGGANGRN
jgi:competence protein ComEA